MTLCFVVLISVFLLLYVEFSVFVYNAAHFKRRNSRGRAKMEKKRGKKGESVSILMHPSKCEFFFYIFEIDAAGNYHSQKSTGGFWFNMLHTWFSL